MRSNDSLERMLQKMRYETTGDRRQEALENVFQAMDESHEATPTASRPCIWRMTMNTRTTRFVLAAAVILIVLGGVTFWPPGSSNNGKWWLGPPAAWGRDLLDSLGKIEAVVYRQRSGRVSGFGPPSMNVGWERRYNAKDRYRRDRYDDGVNVMNTQWVIPDGNDLLMVEVSYQYECYFERRNEAYGFVEDPVEWLSSYVRLLDRADRILDTEVFDGRECVGFEVSAAKYGDNPKGRFDRIWFDVETKLPARIERHGLDFGFDAGQTLVIIHDQFQYFAQIPMDLFVPVIPEGYVNAHPDEIRTARDKQVKGEMVFAQVPERLRERIVAALKAVGTGSYHEGSARICFARNAWRNDRPHTGETRYTLWYVVKGALPEGPFELTDDLGVSETLVDSTEKTYRITDHMGQRPPRHPMAHICFVAGLIDRADRFYESAQIDGVECYGFDVSAKKYGDNPEGAFHRVWFDQATNLPVRMETHWPSSDGTGEIVTVQEQFEWDPVLPEDFFTPQIPPGFTPVKE